MLTVKNYLSTSRLHGVGIFANEPVAKGQLIWKFHPAVDFAYPAATWQQMTAELHPASREQVTKYVYKTNNTYFLCTDNAQFMNHSSQPNVITGPDGDAMYAARDIAQGEELLCDYREYSDPDDPLLRNIP